MPNRDDRPDDPGEWAAVLGDLQRRQEDARAMGGAEKVARQRRDWRMDQLGSEGPWSTADTMGFDEVIDPRELRNALLSGL